MEKRENFTSNRGFILACIGSAVGMGNIWMFPTRISLYGGGSFLIPYIIFVILLANTGVIGEMAFGRAVRSGPVDAAGTVMKRRFGKEKAGIAIGMVPAVVSWCMAVGYTVVMSWIIKYMAGMFTGEDISSDKIDDYVRDFSKTASAFGNNFWLIAALLLALLILIFGVSAGIEKTNKIMMPVFFVMFVGLAIYTAFQPNALEGYRYIFRIDVNELKDVNTWVYAMGQAFFSLSIAGSGTLIYGSYLGENDNVVYSARMVAVFDTLAAVIASLVIIPAMATAGAKLDQGGPGLMFIYLPHLFHGMPGGRIFAIIFFVAVFFAGLSSLINLYETPIATVQEKLHLGRKLSCIIVCGIGLVSALFIQGIVSNWMDIASTYGCPLGAGLMAIMFYYLCDRKYVESEVNKGTKKPVGRWFYPLARYVFTPLCFVVLIVGAVLGGIG
ncbi:MAG: sodium-dependent transporter [Lachnospiraceae bacterium]|nr:sodium-dependent transporter [Lachnospiraceae bacterium]MDD7665336.1 sodium-dependent transporter [Lachnospiraceae bacterium]MDY4164863.1 sodium-dependent transporter [Lachnospiraceae bacterium]